MKEEKGKTNKDNGNKISPNPEGRMAKKKTIPPSVKAGPREKGSNRDGEEVGIPKSAPEAVKREDEEMDKKKGVREGSPADLKADKAIMDKHKKAPGAKKYQKY